MVLFVVTEVGLRAFYPQLTPTTNEPSKSFNQCAAQIEFSEQGEKKKSIIQVPDFLISDPIIIYSNKGKKRDIPIEALPFPELSAIGLKPVPYCKISKTSENPPNMANYRLNNLGMRMNKDSTPKPRVGTKRILLIGDSFVFGTGIDQNETLNYFLDNLLPENTEVLNGGIPTLSSLQTNLLFSSTYKTLEADTVIFLQYMNDVTDNLRPSSKYRRPTYIPENDTIEKIMAEKKPTKKESPPPNPLIHKSHFLTLFSKTMEKITTPKKPLGTNPRLLPLLQLLRKQPIPVIEKAYIFNCDQVLAPLKEAVGETGARFMLVHIPSRLEMDRKAFVDTIKNHADLSVDEFDQELVGRKIAECAKEHNIPFINLQPYFKKYTTQSGAEWYNSHGSHWSPKATQLTARVLNTVLSKEFKNRIKE